MKKALIINAHQFYENMPVSSGDLNRSMVEIIKEELLTNGYEIEQTYIEQGYDIEAEVHKHLLADVIILQSPVYWFGMPWMYKKYVDEVFSAAATQGEFLTGDGRTRTDPSKQYGTGGLMQGKKYMLSLTWNAPVEAFGNADQYLFAGKTVDDVLIANTANYKFCGATILPSYSCHDVMKNPQIEQDKVQLRKHLQQVLSLNTSTHQLEEKLA